MYIIKNIQSEMSNRRFRLLITLLLSICFSLGVLSIRCWLTDSIQYIFLVWNLFLAAIPFIISSYLRLYTDWKPKKRWFALWLAIWLLFFPNAPYILTDLFHLNLGSVPMWFDLVLILSFAWNGMLLGFFSLIDIQRIIDETYNKTLGWLFSTSSIILASFGIYLGRYLRWNSWDILTNPFGLFDDILDRLFHPLQHPTTFGVTIFFSVFLLLKYIIIKQLINNQNQ